jgi:copper oxidase (laccase) domain-containing protein
MHKYEIIPNKVFVNVYDKTFKNSSHLYKSSDTVSMSEVQKNYNAILKHQDSSSMCLLRQNSEADVHVMDKIWTFADNPVADSIITCIPNVIIGIQTADCVPIMLTNRDGKIIAAIHCGWKGALMGVIQNTCDMLRNNLSMMHLVFFACLTFICITTL